MKCIIAEDEAVAARRMQKLLEENQLNVLRVCKSIDQIKEAVIELGEPDLYFFDIHLSDGLVFEIFDICTLKAPVIFTTAYDQYAIKAFKQNSVDYLLKPIDKNELKAALDKFKKHHHSQASGPDLEMISKMLMSHMTTVEYKDRIRIKIGEHFRSIQVVDVPLFYSKDKSNYLYTSENRSYLIDTSLDDVNNSLNPKSFFRINRSVIINIDYIKDVISYSNSRLKVLLKDIEHEELIVARDRVKNFKEWLG